MKMHRPVFDKPTQGGFSLAEVIIAVFLLGVVVLALFGAFSAGMSIIQNERDNIRATQIMLQKMETVRLLTWSQGVNSGIAATNFADFYDPLASAKGTAYQGYFLTAMADTNIPADYQKQLRAAAVTVYWTNYLGRQPVVHSRQVQTFVARYGMQNYVY